MLSCWKEYVKLAWEFICKPGQENLDFLQVKKSEMTGKTKKYYMSLYRLVWATLKTDASSAILDLKIFSYRFTAKLP